MFAQEIRLGSVTDYYRTSVIFATQPSSVLMLHHVQVFVAEQRNSRK